MEDGGVDVSSCSNEKEDRMEIANVNNLVEDRPKKGLSKTSESRDDLVRNDLDLNNSNKLNGDKDSLIDVGETDIPNIKATYDSLSSNISETSIDVSEPIIVTPGTSTNTNNIISTVSSDESHNIKVEPVGIDTNKKPIEIELAKQKELLSVVINTDEIKPDVTIAHVSNREPVEQENVLAVIKNDEPPFKITKRDISGDNKVPKAISSRNKSTSVESDRSTKQSEGNRPGEKITKNHKRKCDETKHNEEKSELLEKFPIQYKGFKKKLSSEAEQGKTEKRINIKWNPFNPACKRDFKTMKCTSRHVLCDDIDSSSLQSEYAQYLGLQPIVKFKCSNCGMSSFQSMSALNSHQVDCKKQDSRPSQVSLPLHLNSVNEHKSANIKLTRKVFLCSACGTYYEHWNLFLHMREVHRRYICLYCLGMFSVAEKLAEHLTQKHNIINQEFASLEDFNKSIPPTFYLLCLVCDKVFTELDLFYDHICESKKSIESEHSLSCNRSDSLSQGSNVSKPFQEAKGTTKRSRESTKKNSSAQKALQAKKELNNTTAKPTSTEKVETHPASIENATVESKGEESILIASKMSPSGLQPSEHESESIKNVSPIVIETEQSDKPQPKQDIEHNQSQVSLDRQPKRIKKMRKVIKKPLKKKKKPLVTISAEEVLPSAPVLIDEPVKIDQESEPLIKEEDILKEDEPSINNEDLKTVSQEETMDVEPTSEVIHPLELEKTPVLNQDFGINKLTIPKNLFKLKLQPSLESDGESDDSQKLSLVVDEQPNNSASNSENENSSSDILKANINNSESSSLTIKEDKGTYEHDIKEDEQVDNHNQSSHDSSNDISLAGEEVAAMALALDDKIEYISIQTVVKECVRTSCLTCNYCRHASKIAVNGKQLALHLLSEHRYMPIKNETTEDVVNKLKHALEELATMFFNSETYDSTDSTLYVPYDKENTFNCFQCNYEALSHKDLYAHKKKFHAKSLLLCIMCKSTFVSYSELLCHLCPGMYSAEILNIDMKFRCCLCNLDSIPSGFRLMVHLRKSHHTCDICLEICIDQQKLSTHMWKHKLSHLCYRCGIAYASKPDITKHLFWKHGTESVLCKKCLQKKWPHVYHFCIPPSSFICEECNASFSKAVALKVHKRLHVNDLPYVCSQCEKKFVSKKLLQRHEERHNKIVNKSNGINSVESKDDYKEEIINVTDVANESQERDEKQEAPKVCSEEEESKDEKQEETKKDKNELDIPPLNLSSDSDSEDEHPKMNEINENQSHDEEKRIILEVNNTTSANIEEFPENRSLPGEPTDNQNQIINQDTKEVQENVNPLSSKDIDIQSDLIDKAGTNDDKVIGFENFALENNLSQQISMVGGSSDLENGSQFEENVNNETSKENHDNRVEEIWENFYKTNPQNANLPYPLCAMKYEVAYGIIMGDHDYCQQIKDEPVIKEDIPSISNLGAGLSDDKLEETNEIVEKLDEKPEEKDPSIVSGADGKKKLKSPKKKIPKSSAENDNSSSSSDSSSDSESSSCSCGTNCSCSSSSSNSTSSSSSDSDSSGLEENAKQDRRDRPKKRRERRSKNKTDNEAETTVKEAPLPPHPVQEQEPPPEPEVDLESEIPTVIEPEDPPIRESELETDETSSDEEFYDREPQRRVSQLMAEKRNQLILQSSTPVNNGNTSPAIPSTIPEPQPLEFNTPTSRQRIRTKRSKKVVPKLKMPVDKTVQNSDVYPYMESLSSKTFSPYHPTTAAVDAKPAMALTKTPIHLSESIASSSENDKSRSSKRRRIPNKFYGYSSGDEEEKPPLKWKKQESPVQHLKLQPPQPSPTPRIQLTVPKQIIRKSSKTPKIKVQTSSNDSSDSGSDENKTLSIIQPVNQPPLLPPLPPLPPPPPPPPPLPPSMPHPSHDSQKPEKDVYCYCRCPYDEVSEMIACDDENCTIEWFHFECVGILVPPRGQWFCPGCRKARGLPT